MSETTDKTSLGDRMKGYENAYRVVLPRRMPVILRVDGKAFHSFVDKEKLDRPFSQALIDAIDEVALELCMGVQGAQLAYAQSDEVSVLIHNYKRLQTGAWFDNNLQKIVSVAASIATEIVNRRFDTTAHFDARAFVLPEAEVCNYFVWRQQDATRNSVQMLARSHYSHRQCENKCTAELQEMCIQAGANWNDLPVHLRRGRFVWRVDVARQVGGEFVGFGQDWRVDREPPVVSQDRLYVERHLAVEPEDK